MSSSIRISGEKYATCGPNTATGWPPLVLRPETSKAFDASCGAERGARRLGNLPLAEVVVGAFCAVEAPPDGAKPPGAVASANWTLPGSGIATPRGCLGGWP